ncbi:polyprenyl synthetase family protein [Halostreptopolyspora alba]|uniref:Polyprenyl synthetase family protein n=1 Tax=Halostreptopolyspora alba TaxID=2487137 RepID=A0A3N0EBU7_9ACTN|nr:polyprenyl synthetase family protein [Nocardiopsaceae bacterium YIM 96095]
MEGSSAVRSARERERPPLPVRREEVRSAVEALLRRYLEGRLRVVEELDEECARDLAAPLVDFTLGGGRRMRSVLAWWGWLAAGGTVAGARAEAALRACAAVELLQSFALTHDDIMDGASRRRGAPSSHQAHTDAHRERGYAGEPTRYGESMAILAGDLALSWADDLLYEAFGELPGSEEASRVWRDLRTEVMVGQFLDLRSQACRERSERAALRADRLKTASYTVERPLHLGAAMAGAPEPTVTALRGYGADVGVAFQLRDDLLDVFGDPDHTGRPNGEDLRQGKNTVLLAVGLELAERAGDREALRILRAVGHQGPAVEQAAQALERVGAREQVGLRCAALAELGVRRLEQLDLPDEVGRGLEEFARTAGKAWAG